MAEARQARMYPPKAARSPSVAKAQIAAARPRDAQGHFLPLPGSRRARIRATAGDTDQLAALLAAAGGDVLAELNATDDQWLADLEAAGAGTMAELNAIGDQWRADLEAARP